MERYGSRFLRIRRNGNSELCKICKGCQIRYNCNGCSILYREFTDVLFGAIAYIFVGGNDIFEVMIRLNLFYMAILVLGLNIWTTNDNALYSAGLGLANIFRQKKKPMVLISGIIGTLLSVWLYYNFCNWLNVLNCTLPPVGIILVLSYFINKKEYDSDKVEIKTVNWFAVIGVIAGAVVANLVSWGIASINGMAVAAVCYVAGQVLCKNHNEVTEKA